MHEKLAIILGRVLINDELSSDELKDVGRMLSHHMGNISINLHDIEGSFPVRYTNGQSIRVDRRTAWIALLDK